MADCEFSVMARQCLDRRIADISTLTREVVAWEEHRNWNNKPADGRFTAKGARIKLKRLYPTLKD